MHRLIALAAAFVFVGAGIAQAHAGHPHKMMGTVKAVHTDMNHVELAMAGGKTGGFYVNGDTKYTKGSAVASLGDLTPGIRVVVDAKMDGDKMVATSVKLAAGTTKPAAAATHKH